MRCQSVPFLVISIGLVAGGCAGVQGVTSNDTGGIIPWTPETQQIAYSIASERCARYTSMRELPAYMPVRATISAFRASGHPTRDPEPSRPPPAAKDHDFVPICDS